MKALIAVFMILQTYIAFAQSGDVVVHLNENFLSDITEASLEGFKFGKGHKLDFKVGAKRVTSTVDSSQFNQRTKDILGIFMGHDISKPLIDFTYDISEIKVKGDLDQKSIRLSSYTKNGISFVRLRGKIKNIEVKIDKIDICETDQVQEGECLNGKKNSVEDLLIKQRKNLDVDILVQLNLDSPNEKVLIKSFNTSIDEISPSELLGIERATLAQFKDNELFKDEGNSTESSIDVNDSEIMAIILSKPIMNDIFSPIFDNQHGLEKYFSRDMRVRLNRDINKSLNELNERLTSQGQESDLGDIKLENEIVFNLDEQDQSEFFIPKIDSSTVEREYFEKRMVQLHGMTNRRIREQIKKHFWGLKIKLVKEDIQAIDKDLTLYYRIDIETGSKNNGKHFRDKRLGNTFKLLGEPDFQTEGSCYDGSIAISEPAINSVLQLGSDLDIFNRFIQDNSFDESMKIDGAQLYMRSSKYFKDNIPRISIVADVEIDIGKTVDEREGFFKDLGDMAMKNLGMAIEFFNPDSGFMDLDSNLMNFPLQLDYKVEVFDGKLVLTPESPLKADGELKNDFGKYSSDLDDKMSFVKEAVLKGVNKDFEPYDDEGNPQETNKGLASPIELDMNNIFEKTNEIIIPKTVEIQDSGYLLLHINLDEQKLFPDNRGGVN
jgi:hypothetical protein